MTIIPISSSSISPSSSLPRGFSFLRTPHIDSATCELKKMVAGHGDGRSIVCLGVPSHDTRMAGSTSTDWSRVNKTIVFSSTPRENRF